VAIAVVFEFTGFIFTRDRPSWAVYTPLVFLPVLFPESVDWLRYIAQNAYLVAGPDTMRGAILLVLTIIVPLMIGIGALQRLPDTGR
jgi:hypothetical protein